MWFGLLEFIVLAVIFIQFIRLLFADADLTLLFKAKFGNKAEVLRGKVVWITGASSGIGEYLAYDMARVGCKLILSARREDQLHRVKQQCLMQGPVRKEDILVLPIDLVEMDTHAGAVDTALHAFHKIDILVNNSGAAQAGWAALTPLPVDREYMELNFFGTLSLTKNVLPHMQKRKSGHIVVTSSLAGKNATPLLAAYCATKYALQGWFDTLRLELSSDNVNVTMVCPGIVVSNISKTLFKGLLVEENADLRATVMTTERCAQLMSIAVANKLDEVWISRNPGLIATYLAQYMPHVNKFMLKMNDMKMSKYLIQTMLRLLMMDNPENM